MTTVLMVSGSWPPAACGVGDYAELLCQHLESAGINVTRYGRAKFPRRYASAVLDEIAASDCDVVHIQYPTAGYGSSFMPGAIARRIRSKPVIVTLHGYSLFRFYRKPWFTPFARYCATRIFTTAFDRSLFEFRFPRRDGFDTTIELANSMPVGAAAGRTENKVIYLGLIAPNKGLEQYLEFCELARARSLNVAAELLGMIPEHARRYAQRALRRARAAGVEIACNLPRERVADRLAQATFAYLPFPDGATATHCSMAAAMINGLAIITRHTTRTPDWLRAVTIGAATPEEACQSVVTLGTDGATRRRLIKRSAMTAKRFRWDSVTARHIELYARLLGLSDEMPSAQATA